MRAVIVVRRWALAAGLATCLVAQPAAAQAGDPVREGDPRERAEWMMRERAYPAAEYTHNPVEAARASRLAMPYGARFLSAWRSLGPFGFQNNGYWGSSPQSDGGRIRAIAIHPRDPSTWYAGSASGGVWRTQNAGASWAPLTDAQCSLTTGAIAIDPVDPTIVYVGTGEPFQSSGCGMLRSFDAGATWTELRGGVLAPLTGVGNQTYRIAIDPASAGSRTGTVVLDATISGLHRSANSGGSWTTVLPGIVTDVRADPVQTGVFWAAVGYSVTASGIYRSSDFGLTWQRVYTAPSNAGRIALALAANRPRKVWAMLENRSDARFLSLVVWDDVAGTSASPAAAGLYTAGRGDFGAQSWYDFVLALDPVNPASLFIGGVRLYQSLDGGASFFRAAYLTHVDWHALEYAPSDPSIMVGGNDGGVHASYDAGRTFISRNTNINVTQFYAGISIHPTQQDVIVGGLQDNSSMLAFGSTFWTYVSGGDGGYSAFNPVDPNIFWTTCQQAGCLYRTTRSANGHGLNVSYRGFSVSGDTRKRFLPPLVIDRSTPATMYYGTYRLWRTLTEGSPGSWTPVTGDLSKGSGYINTIAVAPGDSRVIWVGTSDGNVQRSNDQGATFTLVSLGLPDRAVTDIAVDPADAARAIVTFSGSGTPHVYVTGDQGVTWTNISSNLPDLPFNAAAIIPGTAHFYVGGDVGIYESTSGGAAWTAAFTGMPNVVVTDLAYQSATSTLYAATFGRGMFATTVFTGNAVLRGDVNRDGQVSAVDALLVQQALVGVVPDASLPPMPRGDANCSGTLDSGDAVLILQFAVGAAPSSTCVGTSR